MAESFFYALIVGMALAVLYDVFRFFRFIFNDKFFFDFIFWIISAIVTFCYLLIFNNGEVRMVYFVLFFVGFVLVTLTLGYATKPLQKKIAKKVKNQLKSFKKVLQNMRVVYYNKMKRKRRTAAEKKDDKNGKKNKQKNELA